MEQPAFKNDRAISEVMQKASLFIQRESNGQSMVTVTNAIASSDFKNVTIFVTVFPVHKEEAAIDFLKRQRKEFKHFIKKETRLGRIPQFDFMIDEGEKSRQRIDELL